jgi:hypothetical protein
VFLFRKLLRNGSMPGHAESHNELASLLDIHLERPVEPTDELGDHTELHNEIRERILQLQAELARCRGDA